MGCACKKGAKNGFRQQQQKARANLQSPRRNFNAPGVVNPAVPTEPLSPNLQTPPPANVPDTSGERRRIQRLHQAAINKKFNR